MSTGRGTSHPGLIADTTLAELDKAWKEREDEAIALITAGFLAMGLSLRVYALEIRIKTRICRCLKVENLPKVCKTHDLMELIIYTGLWSDLKDPANEDIFGNWNFVAEFSRRRLNDLRYRSNTPSNQAEFSIITTALDDLTVGVLSWLSKHP